MGSVFGREAGPDTSALTVGRSPLRLVRYAMLCYAMLWDAMGGIGWNASRNALALSCPVVEQTLFIL